MPDGFRDRALLDSLGEGDDSAFWTLWQRYRQHLYQVCLRQMNGAQFDANDAISRSMMMAHAKLPAYAAQIENLEAWLTRLTCNICLDIHRERQRALHGRVDIDDSHKAEEPELSCLHSPEDDYLAGEVRVVVSRALDELPAILRDAADLRFVQEVSYEVIAGTLGITMENARKRVQQARALLRERIKRELEM